MSPGYSKVARPRYAFWGGAPASPSLRWQSTPRQVGVICHFSPVCRPGAPGRRLSRPLGFLLPPLEQGRDLFLEPFVEVVHVLQALPARRLIGQQFQPALEHAPELAVVL